MTNAADPPTADPSTKCTPADEPIPQEEPPTPNDTSTAPPAASTAVATAGALSSHPSAAGATTNNATITAPSNDDAPPAAAAKYDTHTNILLLPSAREQIDGARAVKLGSTVPLDKRPASATCPDAAVEGQGCTIGGDEIVSKAVQSGGMSSTLDKSGKGCDVEGCTPTEVVQGQGKQEDSSGAKHSTCKHTCADGKTCTKETSKGGYCKEHYETLMEGASLLKDLFHSSAASASGEEEDVEDAKTSDAQSDVNMKEGSQSTENTQQVETASAPKCPPNTKGNTAEEMDIEHTQETSQETEEATVPPPSHEQAPVPMEEDEPQGDVSTSQRGNRETSTAIPRVRVMAVPRLPPKSRNPDPKPLKNSRSKPPEPQGESRPVVTSVAERRALLEQEASEAHPPPPPYHRPPTTYSKHHNHALQPPANATSETNVGGDKAAESKDVISKPTVANTKETLDNPNETLPPASSVPAPKGEEEASSVPLEVPVEEVATSSSLESLSSPDTVSSGILKSTKGPRLNQVVAEFLRSWMLSKQHINLPYPTALECSQLEHATGMGNAQIKSWFGNNRRRIWKPMMAELRARHGLAETDRLPQAVLDTLEDAPSVCQPSAVHRSNLLIYGAARTSPSITSLPGNDEVSAAADSVTAAAMLMIGSLRSQDTVSTWHDAKEAAKEDNKATKNEVKSEDARPDLKPVLGDEDKPDVPPEFHEVSTPQRRCYTFVPKGSEDKPPKEQVKFNLGGTVVQVPSDILLKHEESKLASIARSAMRAGDVAIPIPRDYGMFCHCIFYSCNGKVSLPANIRRKAYFKEMKYFGIPFEEKCVTGGSVSPSNSTSSKKSKDSSPTRQEQISPTTVTQLHTSPAQAPLSTKFEKEASSMPNKKAEEVKSTANGANEETKKAVSKPPSPSTEAPAARSTPPSSLDVPLSAAEKSSNDLPVPKTVATAESKSTGATGTVEATETKEADSESDDESPDAEPTKMSTRSSTKHKDTPEQMTTRRSSRGSPDTASPSPQSKPRVGSVMCGTCEACTREDCAECVFCKDKRKFGGPNKLRKKCELRRCPFQYSTISTRREAEEEKAKAEASDEVETKTQEASDPAAMRPPSVEGKSKPSPAVEEPKTLPAAPVIEVEEKKQPPLAAPIVENKKPLNLATSITDIRWHENLELLKPCIEAGGFINYYAIPDGNPEIRKKLRHFVKEQRKQYKRLDNNESTSLTKERLQLLAEANFPRSHRVYTIKAVEAAQLAATAAAEGEVKPSNPFDLLLNATSESFEESRKWLAENPITNEESESEEELFPKFKLKAGPRGRLTSCGQCVACTREDCGRCRACHDKPKFGGPNSMKKRCYNRTCIHRASSQPPGFHRAINKPQPRPVPATSLGGGSYTADLARIRAELDAKVASFTASSGKSFGLKTRSSRRVVQRALLRSQEESDSDSGRESENDDEDGGSEGEERSSTKRRAASISRKQIRDQTVRVDLTLPRGVTQRPSGKWQVQVYYAGYSRYVGLFDTREEAAAGYRLARECMDSSFGEDDDPTPQQLKRNLDEMRKAAFSASNCSDDSSDESSVREQKRRKTTLHGRLADGRFEPKDVIKSAFPEVKRPVGRPRGSTKKAIAAKKRAEGVKRPRGRPRKKVTVRKPAGTFTTKTAPAVKHAPVVAKKAPVVVKKVPAVKHEHQTRRATPGIKPPAASLAERPKRKAVPPSRLRKKKVPEKVANVPPVEPISQAILASAKALAKTSIRGITVRPSGKWQVQIYYSGKSRYIGVFQSKFDAAVAYELARELSEMFDPQESNEEKIKQNVQQMRTRAFSAKDAEAKAAAGSNKKQKTEPTKPPPSRPNLVREYSRRAAPLPAKLMGEQDARQTEDVKTASGVPEVATKPSVTVPSLKPATKPLRASSRLAPPDVAPVTEAKAPVTEAKARVTETKEILEEESTEKTKPSRSPKADEAPSPPGISKAFEILADTETSPVDAAKLNVKTGTSVLYCPEIGPGWKVNIVPRAKVSKWGKQCDYYYYSPSGERFRTLKGAHADAKAKGTSAKANGTDNEQNEHALAQKKSTEAQKSPSEFGVGYTFRKQFGDEEGNGLGWFDGKVVDIVSGSGDKDRRCLYTASGYIEDLSSTDLKELAEMESEQSTTTLGAVGYKFKKQFPDGKWYDGVVVKVLRTVANGKDRRCHYPEDDDFEDMSMADLQRLAELEKDEDTMEVQEEEEEEEDNDSDMQHNDLCESCGKGGKLLCCSTCNLVFHLRCTRPQLEKMPEDNWSCAFCVSSGDVKNTSKKEQKEARLAVKEIEKLKEEASFRRTSPRKRG